MSEALGYAAASAVLASFLMRSMVPLRLVAILSNLLFLSYGYFAQIQPVFVLHAALLPINVARLAALSGSGIGVPGWLSPNRYLASLNDGARYVALFVFGLMAGTLGIRAFIHVALAFVDQCRRSFV
jgi:hypothetical protein